MGGDLIVVLIYIPLMISSVDYSSYTCWPLYVFLRNVISSPLPIFNPFCCCCYGVVGVPYILWILITYQKCGLQTFPPIHRLTFHCFLCCTEAFHFNVAPTVYSCFRYLCFWYHIQKRSLSRTMWRSFSPMFSSNHFTVSSLMFKSLIHFELIVCSVR